MESIAIPIAGALVGILLLRLFYKPLKWGLRMVLNSATGMLTLWAINMIPGVSVPITGATVLTTGVLGLPGLGFLVLLEKLI